AKPECEYGSPAWLSDLVNRHLSVGAELGAVTLDRTTYTQFVVEPVLTIGRFKMALYFPFVFHGDFTSPSNRYRPQGNNEWDFGKQTHHDSYSDAGRKDFLRDLVLKIHSTQYGNPGEELFLNAGSFREMTLGHGALVYKYANDIDFPFVRRVGLHTGFDMDFAGLEVFSADLAEADIFGGRLFVRPIPHFTVGISAVTDKHPVFATPEDAANAFAVFSGIHPRDIDPLMTGFAVEADISVGEKDGDSITLFADAATVIPTLRHEYAASAVGSTHGFLYDALYDESFPGRFRNYGLAVGIMGNLEYFDFRLDYRQYRGLFRYGFFGPNYDHLRGLYAVGLLGYLADPEDSQYCITTAAFYGEAGVSLGEKLHLSAGYLLPRERENIRFAASDNDFLDLRLHIAKGLVNLPVLDKLSFGLDYTREMFAPTFRDIIKGRKAEFVNAYTVLKAELAYAVNDAIDLAFSAAAVAERDPSGAIVYDTDFTPRWVKVFALETRIRF
ncbi:MAG: hypothetical protein FWG35_01605, partial [Spirochaetaceae bacterium]|nr:hypothetical protein [Spirochaetaceae bacterium]